jgi:hypothetical protein
MASKIPRILGHNAPLHHLPSLSVSHYGLHRPPTTAAESTARGAKHPANLLKTLRDDLPLTKQPNPAAAALGHHGIVWGLPLLSDRSLSDLV